MIPSVPLRLPRSRKTFGDGKVLTGVGSRRLRQAKRLLRIVVPSLLAVLGVAPLSEQQIDGYYLVAAFRCQSNAQPCYVATIPAGARLQLVVYADPGNFTGTVTFTSSDSRATLPSPYTFTAANNVASFTVVLRSLGPQAITASDGSGAYGPGTASITVVRQGRVRVVPFRWLSAAGS